MSNLDWFKYEWVWAKTHSPHFLLAKHRPLGINESVLVFCKNTPVYNPQMEKGVRKLNRSGKVQNIRNHKNFGIGVNILSNVESFDYYPKTIIKINSVRRADIIHPTQKPVALFTYLIRTYSNPEGLVLDNVIGSGTTAIAAIDTGRNWIGIEQDPDYYQIAKDRIAKRLKQPMLPGIIEKTETNMKQGELSL